MKTENTLRTVRNSLLCFFMALGAGFLVACGGSGSGVAGGGGGGDGNSGTFHASDWVVGLDYTYLDNGETGKTGEKGVFPLRGGQSVAFSIGNVTLGTLSSVSEAIDDFITPTRIGSEDRAVNVERLLIALDSDVTVTGGATNGTITLNAQSAANAMTVWSALIATTGATTVFVAVSDSVTVEYPVPSDADARVLLANTNNCAFSGAFEGSWTRTSGGVTVTGETALVLLAFNDGQDLPDLATPPQIDTTNADDDNTRFDLAGANANNEKALYINLWKQGGGPETNVSDFGGDGGELAIGLSGFPVSLDIEVANSMTITLMVESYERMTYTSAEESGEYSRVASGDIRDADYRIAGFYADANNGETPAEAEIGIYAFSVNKEAGSVRPYVGWFSSPLAGDDSASVYSNIGGGGLDSSLLTYTGIPGNDTTMTLTDAESERVIIADFTEAAGGGYGAFEDADGSALDLSGGWCAL